MRRVAVTGIGIVSSIGNNASEVLASLREAKSGIIAAPKYAELGFRCQVHGEPQIDWEAAVDRRAARFLAPGTAYAHIAMDQAIADAGLTPEEVSNERTGIIVGEGGPSTSAIVLAADITREKGPKRIGPFAVPKAMCSGPSAVLATWFKIRGINFSISSACATSTHCIGAAAEQIIMGKQDIVFAGGCEELDWSLSNLFDAMGAMSSNFNDTPAKASRPYDKDRDGFVIAGGGAMLVLEDMDRAKARGARIYAEIAGYAANSDGHDMVAPLRRRRGPLHAPGHGRHGRQALAPIDYLNTHGTGTPRRRLQGDGSGARVFGDKAPLISSTKALTGHSLGAAGAQEAVYCLLMMQSGFVAESANIDEIDPAFADLPIARKRIDRPVDVVMSNSFGFGGTNGCLVMTRAD
ncbi:MAG: beta-ketoacyl synthase N-terminal-like domain-containing protein [Caulobacteraceae bacterium]